MPHGALLPRRPPRRGLVRVLPLLRHPRYEVFPAPSTEEAVLQWVPRDVTVTVTASPANGLDPTLDLAARLAGHGYQVVPHLSARLVRDDAHLAEIAERLTASGVDRRVRPGGGLPTRRPARSTARYRCWTGWPRSAARSAVSG